MSTAMTVNGPIENQSIGVTLMHEHLFLNLISEYRATGLLNDQQLISDEVDLFRAAGGSTIVELTPAELTVGAAPDPSGIVTRSNNSDFGWPSRTPSSVRAVQAVSQETGVNVILGTGHYRDPYLGSGWIDAHSVDQIAETIVKDLTQGFEGTSVRAGIIGEVGSDKWYISALEERSFRAAARAQKRTNSAITTHAARWPVGIPQLDLLVSEGVDPSRVIIGHCNSVRIPEYHIELARRGAYVQFDLIRGDSIRQIEADALLVKNMIDAGFRDRILMSHDVCTTSQLKANGGCGYTFVITDFREALKSVDISDEEIDQILVMNPRKAITGE